MPAPDLDTAAFETRVAETAAALERVLSDILRPEPGPGETLRPARLIEAMRYAVLGGGKRLRPFLLVETARLFGREPLGGVLRAGAALEYVHCYSLAHDDLPAMDDDDLRRGKPSLHRAFDEATAILAGDALLTLAFDIIADVATDHSPEVRMTLTAGLARAGGVGGMAGGQMLDIESGAADGEARRTMRAMKTGALFRYAAEAGAVLGRAEPEARAALAEFGAKLGLAFQVADDIADATPQERQGEALAGAREELARLVEEAKSQLGAFENASTLRALADFIQRSAG